MMERIKYWLAETKEGLDIPSLLQWSQKVNGRLILAKEEAAFSIEGRSKAQPWRLDWGPTQRSYIAGYELLMRIELNLPVNLQMLLMNEALAKSLEEFAFAKCVQSVHTVIDFSLPEEIRWLSMFPKAPLTSSLAPHYDAWSSSPSLASWWLEGQLSAALQKWVQTQVLPEKPPFLLMTLRGRLYLRCQLSAPTPAILELIYNIFTIAGKQSLQIASMDSKTSITSKQIENISSGLWRRLIQAHEAQHQYPPSPPVSGVAVGFSVASSKGSC